MSSFVHLHVHSHYSILDGQAKVQDIVDKAIQDGMPAVALTDHGNMFGIKEFLNYVKKKNAGKEEASSKLKPIVGCEVYVARNGRMNKENREVDLGGWHLILLAKNMTGYYNLVKMVSEGYVNGFYGRPRIDKELLSQYHEGLICSSACLGGEIAKLILSRRLEEAEKSIDWYHSLFGEDYYLELMRHPSQDPTSNMEVYPLQVEVNNKLLEFSKKKGIKCIATNDSHFTNKRDAEAHDHLICLSTGKDLEDPKRMRYTKQEWFKSTKEMSELFKDIPEAIENTLEIAEKVEFYDIDHKPIMPNFPIPKEFESADKYLRFLTQEGAKRKYGEKLTEEVQERIDFELQTICQMGFPGYFLIVQDFIKASRERGVSVGPGRGSAAGSVVAYCLDITNVDPIQYDLLFERFLNPDRISMPDIDIDFDDEGRGTALQYVIDKYGKEKVAHIITFGTMATKSSIADVARVEKLPLPDSQYLCKLVPAKIPNVKKVTLEEAIKAVPELKEASESDDIKKRNTMRYAQDLEGTVRNTGVHACGIIIAKDELSKFVPMSTVKDKESGEEMLVTQYEGSVIEEVGMLKMDFLGLKNLSIIRDALKNIEYTCGEKIDLNKIPLTDSKTFKLYQAGKTVGTFQFESGGMQKYLRDLKPTTFEDLIAMNALYRPGPMDYIPSFIARKQGKEPIVYDIPCMEKYLKNTYGITVYQEQVMLLSRQLAGFTRGESDTLRKAMGKKQIDKMNSLKVKFMEGTAKNGYDAKTCEKIWLDWERFASYAFNKSHATCYSLIAYQTAYLKANYPPQYMAALLNSSMKDITEVSKYMDECQKMRIKVFGPDVNESMPDFGVNKKGNIRFGLAAIKGVGEGAALNIIEERKKNGEYSSIFDFVKRINLTTCNRRVIESLAYSGAFDSFKEITREQFFVETEKGEQFIDLLIRFGGKFQMDKEENCVSLFGESEVTESPDPSIPKAETWGETFRLEKEKELIGFYTSSHPLDRYAVILKYVCNTPMSSLKEKENLVGKTLILGGVVCDMRTGNTKNGKPYGILKLEDYSGIGDIALFGKEYLDHQGYFQKGLFLYITAKMEPRKYNEQVLDFSITSIKLLQDVEDTLIHKVSISLPESKMDIDFFSALESYIEENKGGVPLFLNIYEDENPAPLILRLGKNKIKVEKKLLEWIEGIEDCSVSFN